MGRKAKFSTTVSTTQLNTVVAVQHLLLVSKAVLVPRAHADEMYIKYNIYIHTYNTYYVHTSLFTGVLA